MSERLLNAAQIQLLPHITLKWRSNILLTPEERAIWRLAVEERQELAGLSGIWINDQRADEVMKNLNMGDKHGDT